MRRSARVCTTCKARKKACDKSLPNCGYCTKRGLRCTYVNVPYIDYRQNVVRATTAQKENHHQALSAESRIYRQSFSTPPSSSLLPELTTLGEFLELQCNRILYSTAVCPEKICDLFFLGVHRWLPVICPRRFNATLSKYRGLPLPGDVSLLLLTMWLITSHSRRTCSGRHQPSDVFSRTTRILLTHMQAQICASACLVQAGLLLSACEYALGHAKSAYITIGFCTGMACILGLDRKCQMDEADVNKGSRSLSDLEQCNVWWGIVALERYVQLALNPGDRGGTEKPHTDQPKD